MTSSSISAIAVGKGIVIGRAVVMPTYRVQVHQHHIAQEEVEKEVQKLYDAKNALQRDLDDEIKKAKTLAKELPDEQEALALLDVQAMMLEDGALLEAAAQWVRVHRYNAAWALHSELHDLLEQYEEVSDAYLKERANDVEQTVQSLLQYVETDGASRTTQAAIWESHRPNKKPNEKSNDSTGVVNIEACEEDVLNNSILVAHDLTPSDMFKLQRSTFRALVTEVGSATTHVAILARGMDIPALVGAVDAITRICNGDILVLDTHSGVLLINPSKHLLSDFLSKAKAQQLELEALNEYIDRSVFGTEGQRLTFYVNIHHPDEAETALRVGADGIGLFRTEFMFIGANTLPSEEEQFVQYSQLLQTMQGRPVTIRVLDIGADKVLAGYETSRQEEPNPALGVRGLRWCRQHTAIFRTQLRALLRASVHGYLRILIPMLTNIEEAHYCKRMVEEVREELRAEGVPVSSIELGAMVEVPASVFIADALLTVFDFLSIGTNDLVQYTLAVDRNNQAVSYLQNNLHPAVLALIEHTVAAGKRASKQVSVCGEMAGRVECVEELLRMGLQCFSTNTSQLLEIKSILGKLQFQ